MSVENDPEKTAFLREIADEIRDGEEPDTAQIAAVLYRVSDLYDPNEETTPQEIYLNMRYILSVKENYGIQR